MTVNGDRLNGKTGEWLRWALSLLLAGLVAYLTTAGTMQTRVSVAETNIGIMQKDIAEIKSDVKALLQRGAVREEPRGYQRQFDR